MPVTVGTLAPSRAIKVVDWTGLFVVVKRGGNRPVPQQPGRAFRTRYPDEARVGLTYRLDGSWDGDTFVAGGEDVQRGQVYRHLAALRTIVDVDGLQDLRFARFDIDVTVDCVVEGMDPPSWVTPTIAEVTVDVTLPDGPLELELGS